MKSTIAVSTLALSILWSVPAAAEPVTLRFGFQIVEFAGVDGVLEGEFPVGSHGWFDLTYDSAGAPNRPFESSRGTLELTLANASYLGLFTRPPDTGGGIGGNWLWTNGNSFLGEANLGGGPGVGTDGLFGGLLFYFNAQFLDGFLNPDALPTQGFEDAYLGGSMGMRFGRRNDVGGPGFDASLTQVTRVPAPPTWLLVVIGGGLASLRGFGGKGRRSAQAPQRRRGATGATEDATPLSGDSPRI